MIKPSNWPRTVGSLSSPSRGSYGTWLGEDKLPTVRGQLEGLIDTALSQGCKDFDSFLAAMRAAGVEVKRGKHLAFKIPDGKRFIRCDSLGNDYTEAAIMERISSKRIVVPKARAAIRLPEMRSIIAASV